MRDLRSGPFGDTPGEPITSPATAAPARDRQLANALPIVAAFLFLLFALRRVIYWEFRPASSKILEYISYNHAVIAPNYFDDGFIRRGLSGTVLALLDGRHDPTTGITFQIFSAAWLIVPLALLLRRAAARDLRIAMWLALVLVLSPQMLSWGIDIARTDMFTSGFVAWAVVAALSRRWTLAALALGTGSLAHETVVILGTPLLVSLWYLDYRGRGEKPGSIAIALATLALFLGAAAVLQRMFGASAAELAATIKRATAQTDLRDVAIYITIVGGRSIPVGACVTRASAGFWLFITTTFVVLPIYGPVLGYRNRAHWLIFAAIGFVPLLFLSLVAYDYGRWLVLASFNVWLGAAALAIRGAPPPLAPQLSVRRAVPFLLLLFALGPPSIFVANRWVERLADRIWVHAQVPPVEAMDRCEPGWRKMAETGKVP